MIEDNLEQELDDIIRYWAEVVRQIDEPVNVALICSCNLCNMRRQHMRWILLWPEISTLDRGYCDSN